jgi:CBS domain-containing protein
MRARELMTKDPACVTPDDTLQRVAQLMAENDCGCIPVVEGPSQTRVVGVVTDRDIALRAVARGKAADAVVADVMTRDVAFCPPDADLLTVERTMSDRQIRRVVIADADGCCVGIVSQADLARAAARGEEVDEREVVRVVESISQPT